MAEVNSFIIYKETNPNRQIDLVQYRKRILQLVADQHASQPPHRRGRHQQAKHFIAMFTDKKSKDSAVCSDSKNTWSKGTHMILLPNLFSSAWLTC